MVVFDEASPMLADVMWLQMVFACCVLKWSNPETMSHKRLAENTKEKK